MKIVVNTRFLIKNNLDGIGWVTHETLSRLTRHHSGDEFYFLFDRPFSPEFIYSSNIHPVVLRPAARHPLLWHIWFQHSVMKYLKNHPADMFFSPDGFVPLKIKIPCISVIHDLNFLHYPDELPLSVSYYYRKYFSHFAKKSTRIITVSEFSKQDIIQYYGIEPDNIEVIYNGVDPFFKPLSEEEKEKMRAEYTEGKPFFIHIGSLLPRKNIPRLLKAFDAFRNRSDTDHKLVIAGRPVFKTREIQSILHNMKYSSDVIMPGGLPQKEIHLLLGSAEALVFASYFEGFGIPLIEAMACHVPVITSNITALPEVCGDAALYIDPFSADSIRDAMLRITSDTTLRNQLIEKGKKRVTFFNWDITAAKVWKVMEQITQQK